MDIEPLLKRIREVISVSIDDVKIYDKTWGNFVVEINNKWIFRFSKSEESKKLLLKEKLFLSEFAESAPIEIPRILFSEDDFIAYQKIEGEALTPSVFEKLSNSAKENIAKDLALFLLWLHKLDFKSSEIRVIETPDKKLFMRKFEKLSNTLSPVAKVNADKYFREFDFDMFKNLNKILIHNDFGEGNILINKDRVSGIIDFGRLMYGYPEMDFAKLWRNFGKEFAKAVVEFCGYDQERFEFIGRYDLFQREEPFYDKIEKIFGESIKNFY